MTGHGFASNQAMSPSPACSNIHTYSHTYIHTSTPGMHDDASSSPIGCDSSFGHHLPAGKPLDPRPGWLVVAGSSSGVLKGAGRCSRKIQWLKRASPIGSDGLSWAKQTSGK
ncbi:uncharacterized protein TRIREDRAFT_108367 [Trichoderma reesei QM6a]|uniref:Predicted protein n=1 Tax=Hypocrea jecorina (strain QM6a) TaxID=431241 RepID=G0RLK8_HYPJQ|nr:uncharacterized protein TRIREDRAFT_108367 [Trichoderma reesei QM6a]EGR48004.1 predicted protein [Trichoderma reesei QM6a]